MKADFPVVLDANVLAEAAVSDLFLRLSEEPRLLLPRWSLEIWAETRRIFVEKLGWPEELAERRIEAATGTFPEAMISGYEHIVDLCQNHPGDRHVLAAAIHSRTETIVTFNVKDFKTEALQPWGVHAEHPADYLKVLYDHDPVALTNALHAMAGKANRSVPDLLGRLAWYVAPFARYVANRQSLELPEVSPTQWRTGAQG